MTRTYANPHEWLGAHLESLRYQLNDEKALYQVACGRSTTKCAPSEETSPRYRMCHNNGQTTPTYGGRRAEGYQ